MGRVFSDGSTDKVTAGSAAVLDDLAQCTVILWVNPSSTANSGRSLCGKTSGGELDFRKRTPDGTSLIFEKGRAAGACFVISNTGTLATSTWICIAATLDTNDVNNCKIYKALLSASAMTDVTSSSSVGSGAINTEAGVDLIWGNSDATSSVSFPGTLAYAALFNRVLSTAEMYQWARRPQWMSGCVDFRRFGSGSPEPDFSGNANAGTVTGTSVGDSVPLPAPWGADVDLTLLAAPPPVAPPAATGLLHSVKRWLIQAPLGAQVERSHPHTLGLIAAWTMREGGGTKLYDASGRGNTGTLGGTTSPTWTTTPWGRGLNFTGGRVDCGNITSPTTEITLVAWFRSSNLDASAYRSFINKEQSGTRLWWFGTSPSAKLYLELNLAGGNMVINGTNTLTVGSLYMAAAVWTGDSAPAGSAVKLYLNGVQDFSGTPVSGPITGTGTNVWIGSYSAANFLGDILDVRIYERALPAQTLQSMYINRHGLFTPRSSNRRVWAADPATGGGSPSAGSSNLMLMGVG